MSTDYTAGMRLLLNVARYAALVACVAGALQLGVVILFFDGYGLVSRADVGVPPRPASDLLEPLLWTLGFGLLTLGLQALYVRRFRSGLAPLPVLLRLARFVPWTAFLVLLLNLIPGLLLHDGWLFTSPDDLGMRPGYLRTPLLWALGAGAVLAALYWTHIRAVRRDWLDWTFILSVVWLLLTLALTSGDESFVLPLRFVLGLGFVLLLRGRQSWMYRHAP